MAFTRRDVLGAAALAPLMTKLSPADFEVEVDYGAVQFRAFERHYFPALPLDPALEVAGAARGLSARARKILLAAYVSGGPEIDHTDDLPMALAFAMRNTVRSSRLVIAAETLRAESLNDSNLA